MDFMKGAQSIEPRTVLIGLLTLFLFQGAFLSLLFPIFQQPDEQVHYGTIQHLAEPEEKTWEMYTYEKGKYSIDVKDIRTSNLPEEMVQSAYIAKFNELTFERQNIQDFSDESLERQITENNWKRYVDVSPAATSGTKSVYYLFASWLERFFSDENIFFRIFSIRLFSTLFGLGVVILGYLTARKVGFSENSSLPIAALIAFQPQFSMTAAQVNIDIALVFSFSLFLYAGACVLRDGLNRGNAALAIFAAILGVLSKGPGIVLIMALYPLFAWGAYRKIGVSKKRFFASLAVITVALAGIALIAIPKSYLISITNATAHSKFDSPLKSIGKYLDKTISMGEFRDSSLSYWGNFGWLDTPIPGWMLSVINWIEIVGFAAVLAYLLVPVLKKMNWIAAVAALPRNDKTGWVPERRYLVFFLGMILALQFAIRFYDWRVFDTSGQVLIGQPGRYFLPNLIGHLVLVVVGVRLAVSWVKHWIAAVATLPRNDKIDFEMILKILALAMILLQLYAIVNVIIPRYYL